MPLPKTEDDLQDAFNNLKSDDNETNATGALTILKYVDTELQQSGKDVPASVTQVLQTLVGSLVSHKSGVYTLLQTLIQLQPSVIEPTYTALKKNYGKKKKGEGENQVAEVLGYGALIQSGHLDQYPQVCQDVVLRLLDMRKEESIDFMVTQVVVDLFNRYHETPTCRPAVDFLISAVKGSLEDKNENLLWLWTALQKKGYKIPKWLSAPLTSEDLSAVGNIVMSCSKHLPIVHPLAQEVVGAVEQTDSGLVKFWEEAVLPQLATASAEGVKIPLLVLETILAQATVASDVPGLFGDKLVKYFVTNCKENPVVKASLMAISTELEKIIKKNEESENETSMDIVKKFINAPGSVCFDSHTNSPVVSTLVKQLNTSSIKALGKCFTQVMKDADAKKADQTTAAEALAALVVNPKVEQEVEWKVAALKDLMASSITSDGVTKKQIKHALMNALEHEVMKGKDYEVVMKPVVDYITLDLQKHISEGKEEWNKARKILNNLDFQDESQINTQILKILCYALLMYILECPSKEKVDELLQEIDKCCKDCQSGKSKPSKKKKKVTIDTKWLISVTEVLLTFLPEDTKFFKTMMCNAFRIMSPSVPPEVLVHIIAAFQPEEEEEPEDEELEEEEEEMDEDEGDTMDEDNDDEEEEVEEEEEGDDDDDSGMEDDPIDDEEVAKMRSEILEAQGDIQWDVDLDSASKEDLDGLDKTIGLIIARFKEKRKNKMGLEGDEAIAHNIRMRALDLLDVYIEEHPSMGQTLGLVEPLLATLAVNNKTDNNKADKQKEQKIRKMLDAIGMIKEFNNVDMSLQELEEELNAFLEMSNEYVGKFPEYIKECYTVIVQCSLQILGEAAHEMDNPVIMGHAKHLEQLVKRRDNTRKIEIFSGPCLLDCGALWGHVKHFGDYAFSPKNKLISRTSTIPILKLLYSNTLLFKRIDQKEVKEVQGKLSKNILDVLKKAAKKDLTIQLLFNLFEFLFVVGWHHSEDTSGFEWEEIQKAVLALNKVIPKNKLGAFRKLYNRLRHEMRSNSKKFDGAIKNEKKWKKRKREELSRLKDNKASKNAKKKAPKVNSEETPSKQANKTNKKGKMDEGGKKKGNQKKSKLDKKKSHEGQSNGEERKENQKKKLKRKRDNVAKENKTPENQERKNKKKKLGHTNADKLETGKVEKKKKKEKKIKSKVN